MVSGGCFPCANSSLPTKSYGPPPFFPIPKSKTPFPNHNNLQKTSSVSSPFSKAESLRVNAADSKPSAKVTSIVCSDCDGNGAIVCKQCEGNGVNSVDHFNGQFKAGGLCWLCRGKREVLCGSCNGAGFIGGFMNSG